MGRRIVHIALAALLASSAFIAANIRDPQETTQAAGLCSVGYLRVWSNAGRTGSSRQYCSGVNDSWYSGPEPGNAMGPLYNDTYADDFDSSSSTSGVSSYYFYDAPGGTDLIVCFYNSPNYVGLVQWDTTTGGYGMGVGVDNVTESFAFSTAAGGCP